MASPENQHCASCIGTHSFPYYHAPHRGGGIKPVCDSPVCLSRARSSAAAIDRTDRQTDTRPLYKLCTARAGGVSVYV